MKRFIMCAAGAMMVLSLAACTPTTETPEETVAVLETGAPGGREDKVPDPEAPELQIVSLYYENEVGDGLEFEMEGVESLDAESLVEKLADYGVLSLDTQVLNFSTEGEVQQQAAGPGAAAAATIAEKGTLDLSVAPDDRETVYQAVANTITENLNVVSLDILVNGEPVATGLTFKDVK